MEVGVYLPIVNLDYKIKNRKDSKEQSIYDIVGCEDENIYKMHNQDLVVRLMKCLNERDNMVLILYYFEEYTQSEISKLMHMSESHVSKIVVRSLKKMRKEFEKGIGNKYAVI